MDGKPRVLAALPTYNEACNIKWIVESLLSLDMDLDVLVVDDSSPDGTAELAQTAGPPEKVSVHLRPGKMGLGGAQRAGMRAGIDGGYDRVVIMDADGSHAPESVPALVAAADDHDVAIGSRYVPGGKVVNWAWHRVFLSKGANTAARLVLGGEIRDWTSSFRCYRVDMLAKLDFERFRSDGYAFAEEMLFECRYNGFSTVEVPITFVERRAGKSKIDRTEVFSAIYRLFAMGLKRLTSPGPSARGYSSNAGA